MDTEFRQLLTAFGCQQSMSRAGETYDNAFAESLFSRYKAERLEGGAFRDVAEAELETCEYLERYYNPVRRHSALGYVSPLEYERAYYPKSGNGDVAQPTREEYELREFTVHQNVTTSAYHLSSWRTYFSP